MDPLSVLGVVAATVQFVDFSSKLLSRSFRIYTSKSGGFYDSSRVEIAQKLHTLNDEIKKSSEIAIQATITDQNERNLLELCDGCNDVAQELLESLSKLGCDKTKRKEWQSFRKALQSIWSDDALNQLERRLGDYRQQISLHILWGMRKQLQGGLNNLAQEQQRTREDVLDLVGERRDLKEGVIAAIGSVPWPGVKPTDFNEGQSRFVQMILQHLRFQKISKREERIPDAHKATFKWIFEPPRNDQPPWADFGKWLQSDSDMYWITGKAGAGKSTLMKYIGNDPRTAKILTNSAGSRQVVIARFYFWNSGVELQMTREGLLRTLIHDILEQFNDLAIKAYPQRWELFRLFGIFDPEPLDYLGLQHQLDQIINADPSTQFVFFIDGLDEFIGDCSDLATYVKSLSENTTTKVCVSSRPWNEFEDAFSSKPSLRVETLTYQDIFHFIQSNFNESPGYRELRAENEAEAEALLIAIASKASGVFLWVSLVVKSLLSGLTDGEKLSKLRRRLDSLPPDLEHLFQGMLDQISHENQEDASRLFQIVRAAIEPPTVMTLAWADEDDPDLVFSRAVRPLSSREKDAKSQRMRRRLRSHCKGLLEAGVTSLSEGTVEFLHRTVKDFLFHPEIWSKLQSHTPASFHPEQALCRSYLLQLKCVDFNVGPAHGLLEPILQSTTPTNFCKLLSTFVRYAHKHYRKTGDAQLQLYDELAKTTEVILSRTGRCVETSGSCWCKGPADHDDGPFLSLAISLHIIPYVDARLKALPIRDAKNKGGHSTLQIAVSSMLGVSEPWKMALCYVEDEFQLLRLLLACGADPNLKTYHCRISAWQLLLQKRKYTLSPDIVMEFLRKGADPRVNLNAIHVGEHTWEPVLALQKRLQNPWKANHRTMGGRESFFRRLKFWG